jgi:hypothetical protein
VPPVGFFLRDIIGYLLTGAVILGVAYSPIARAIGHRIMHGKPARLAEGAEDPRVEDLSGEVAALREQLETMHERVDFTERLLAQAKDRGQLGPGDGRGGA